MCPAGQERDSNFISWTIEDVLQFLAGVGTLSLSLSLSLFSGVSISALDLNQPHIEDVPGDTYPEESG
jgi:hypothetical protein